MNLSTLGKYDKIVVTGPQRSGTRITATIIAHDLSYRYIDEMQIRLYSMCELFKLLLASDKVVIQCPHISAICHMIDTPSTTIIFTKRNLKDISKSQKRVEWKKNEESLKQYFFETGDINEIKYRVWEQFQKPQMKVPYYEIEYESLKEHPLWVDNHKEFAWNQVSI